MKNIDVLTAADQRVTLRRSSAILGSALLLMTAFHAQAEQATTALPKPWISCSDVDHVAYRVVPPALNPHNMFTQPIKVNLKPSQSCADLK